MESVGEFFRQVRETKGLALEDVAAKTRIHPEFLRALEEGNYAKLPEEVFAKGFVRSYARSLGLDEDDAMRRFGESAGTFYHKQTELDALRVREAADERQRQANRKVLFIAIGMAVAVFMALFNRQQSSAPVPRQAAEVEPASGRPTTTERGAADLAGARKPVGELTVGRAADTSIQAALPPVEKPGSEVVPTAPPPLDVVPAPAAPMAGDPLAALPIEPGSVHGGALLLDLEALELSWVVVQVDDASPHEALMRPGDRIRWKASERFTLTLGNAGGVRVELNGKPQGPFGPRGKVVRDIVIKRS